MGESILALLEGGGGGDRAISLPPLGVANGTNRVDSSPLANESVTRRVGPVSSRIRRDGLDPSRHGFDETG